MNRVFTQQQAYTLVTQSLEKLEARIFAKHQLDALMMIHIDRTATTLLMMSGGFTPPMIDSYFKSVERAIKSHRFEPLREANVWLRLDALGRRADVFGTQRLKTPSHLPGSRRLAPARKVWGMKRVGDEAIIEQLPPPDWAALFRDLWATFERTPVSARRRRQVLLDIPPPR